MKPSWRWAGACSIGSSHVKAGLPCQDRASCRISEAGEGELICAVVSDGAGSAREAARGASIVCAVIQRLVALYTRSGGRIESIDADLVANFLDDLRDRIHVQAASSSLVPRDFAATLVAVLAAPDRAVVIHVGDGAAVVRYRSTAEWDVPSWPFHGEYASTTRFVTDDPQPVIALTHIAEPIDRFALFSDGMESLLLDFRQKSAPKNLFERFTSPVAGAADAGRHRALSRHLRAYLDSPKVREATDDDKSVILACRP